MSTVSAPQNIPSMPKGKDYTDDVGSPKNIRQLRSLCANLESDHLSPHDPTWGLFSRTLLNSSEEKIDGLTFQGTFETRLNEYISNVEKFLKTADGQVAQDLLKSLSKVSLLDKLELIKDFDNNSSIQGRLWARADGWGS